MLIAAPKTKDLKRQLKKRNSARKTLGSQLSLLKTPSFPRPPTKIFRPDPPRLPGESSFEPRPPPPLGLFFLLAPPLPAPSSAWFLELEVKLSEQADLHIAQWLRVCKWRGWWLAGGWQDNSWERGLCPSGGCGAAVELVSSGEWAAESRLTSKRASGGGEGRTAVVAGAGGACKGVWKAGARAPPVAEQLARRLLCGRPAVALPWLWRNSRLESKRPKGKSARASARTLCLPPARTPVLLGYARLMGSEWFKVCSGYLLSRLSSGTPGGARTGRAYPARRSSPRGFANGSDVTVPARAALAADSLWLHPAPRTSRALGKGWRMSLLGAAHRMPGPLA